MTAKPRWSGFLRTIARVVFEDAISPVDEPASEAGVGVPDGAGPVGGQERPFAAVAVLPAGGQHHHGDQQAEGVGDDEPLTAVDFLTGVVATGVGADGARFGSR